MTLAQGLARCLAAVPKHDASGRCQCACLLGQAGAPPRRLLLVKNSRDVRQHVAAGGLDAYTSLQRGSFDHSGPSTSARQAATLYFERFNARDLEGMVRLLAHDCYHQGLAYADPFVGKQAVRRFFREFMSGLPSGIQLVVDEMTEGEGDAVGAVWHLELGGRELPFGKGLSFLKVNQRGEICFVRESPEHFVKVTGAALPALKLAAPFLSGLAPLLEPLAGLAPPGMPSASSFARMLPGSMQQSFQPSPRAPPSSQQDWRPSVFAEEAATRRALADMETELHQARVEKAALEARLQRLLVDPPPQPTQQSAGSPAAASSSAGTQGRTSPAEAAAMAARMAEPAAAPARPAVVQPAAQPTSVTGSSGQEVRMVELPLKLDPSQRSAGYAASTSSAGGPPAATGAQSPAAPGPRSQADAAPVDLSGIWIKDFDASDTASYERALAVMKLGSLQRTTALRLIEGLELQQRGDKLTAQFLTVVPFFKVTEKYELGRATTMGRRDLRRGQQQAVMSRIPGGVNIDMSWGPPHAGVLNDKLTMPEKGVLHVLSSVTVDGQTETTLQVYRREAVWQPKNKFNSSAFGLSSFPLNPWADHK